MILQVHVPTWPYIRHYVEKKLPSGLAERNQLIGAMLIELLSKNTNAYKSKAIEYPDRLVFNINKEIATRTFLAKCDRYKIDGEIGIKLKETQVMNFNGFAARLIKHEFRTHILTYMHFDKRLSKAVEFGRMQMDLSEDLLSDDAIIKDFQRHRRRYGGPTIYKK